MATKSFAEFAKDIYKTSPLLKTIEPAKKNTTPTDPVILTFLELVDFYKEHERLPELSGDVNERQLANYLNAFRTRLRSKVEPYDDIGILNLQTNSEKLNSTSTNIIKNFGDILKTDTYGLLGCWTPDN